MSPSHPDFLVAWSTIPGFVSFRDENLGSWFMQSLCIHMLEYGGKLEHSKIVDKVKKDVKFKQKVTVELAKNEFWEIRQIPYIYSTLSKSVFFQTP